MIEYLTKVYHLNREEKLKKITEDINEKNLNFNYTQNSPFNYEKYTEEEIDSIFTGDTLDSVCYLVNAPKFEIISKGDPINMIMGAVESEKINYVPIGHYIYLYRIRRVNGSNIWNLRYIVTDRITDEMLLEIRNEKIKEILQ